ncbi:DUF3923 family protein [Lactobacillus sp. UCMA15818]|uniref:DUF3923 family protein n=1 Tax=Lactobacillaceae TaxID=33958 RepID=UPI0025B1E153|nr:DUF3923 family protein [Lactobacillus sp. UCMA15818]MDN2453715.1 DUF3923 family protein [Lactobacillus sp. UCMA15818]
MKLKMWWLSNLIWLLIFGVLSFILMTRRIDGSGAVQTPKTRVVSLIVLAVFFIVVAIIQLVILIFVKRKR